MLTKPKIFCFGACDLWDSVDISQIRDEFDLDRYYFRRTKTHTPFNHQLLRFDNDLIRKHEIYEISEVFDVRYIDIPPFSTSLMAMYSPAGSVNDQMFEFIKKIDKECRAGRDPSDYYLYISLFQEMSKWSYLKFFETFAGPDDFLVINFTTELYSKFVKNECITLTPNFLKGLQKSELSWLNQQITNADFHRSFDQEDILGPTIELVKDFARELYPIFGNRVILVDTLLTDLIYSDTLDDIRRTNNLSCFQIPFYKPTKLMTDPTDKSHVKRLLRLATKGFRRSYKTDIPFVTLDQSECFLDPEHKYGPSPFHLHKKTTEKVGNKIYEEIKKIQTREKLNESRISRNIITNL